MKTKTRHYYNMDDAVLCRAMPTYGFAQKNFLELPEVYQNLDLLEISAKKFGMDEVIITHRNAPDLTSGLNCGGM
jgi:hypothetical protein